MPTVTNCTPPTMKSLIYDRSGYRFLQRFKEADATRRNQSGDSSMVGRVAASIM